MKKRLLSLLLVFVMVLGMLPVQAFAADDTVTTNAELKASYYSETWYSNVYIYEVPADETEITAKVDESFVSAGWGWNIGSYDEDYEGLNFLGDGVVSFDITELTAIELNTLLENYDLAENYADYEGKTFYGIDWYNNETDECFTLLFYGYKAEEDEGGDDVVTVTPNATLKTSYNTYGYYGDADVYIYSIPADATEFIATLPKEHGSAMAVDLMGWMTTNVDGLEYPDANTISFAANKVTAANTNVLNNWFSVGENFDTTDKTFYGVYLKESAIAIFYYFAEAGEDEGGDDVVTVTPNATLKHSYNTYGYYGDADVYIYSIPADATEFIATLPKEHGSAMAVDLMGWMTTNVDGLTYPDANTITFAANKVTAANTNVLNNWFSVGDNFDTTDKTFYGVYLKESAIAIFYYFAEAGEDEGGDDVKEAVEITVKLTAQANNKFLCAPQFNLTVSSLLSDNYGYTDTVEDGVSALDALIAAHVAKYGEDISAYLTVDADGKINKMFGTETAYGVGAAVDQEISESDVSALTLADNDYVILFAWQTEGHSDKIVQPWSGKYGGSKITSMTRASVGFTTYGWFFYSDGTGASDLQVCLVDRETGEITDLEGTITASGTLAGRADLVFDEAGEYLLSAYLPSEYGTAAVMPLLELTMKDTPTFDNIRFYRWDGVNKLEDQEIEITPEFDNKVLTGYSILVPDTDSSVWTEVYVNGSDTPLPVGYMNTVTINGVSCTPMFSSGYSEASYSATASKGTKPNPASDGTKFIGVEMKGDVYVEYRFTWTQYATMSDLSIDGVLGEDFERLTMDYTAVVDPRKEGVTVTATAGYNITVNGVEATSGEPCTVPYAWEDDGTMKVEIVLSGNGKVSSTYTITVSQMSMGDMPTISQQPVGEPYIVGDTANALTVIATASGELTYQWYSNTTESYEGATAIEGATEASYTPSTAEISKTYYFCRVTNTGAETDNVIDTDIVMVGVYGDPTPVVTIKNEIPAITEEGYPAEYGYILYMGGEGVTLEVETTSAAEGGTWSGYWIQGRNPNHSGSIVGGTVGTSIDNVNDTGWWFSYRAVYTFKGVEYVTYSDHVYVFVKTDSIPDTVFTRQPPETLEYVQGDSVVGFSVYAALNGTNNGTTSYQWYVNDTESYEGATPISGGSSNFKVSTSEVGVKYYFCHATTTLQGLTSEAYSNFCKVTVTEKLVIEIDLDGSGTQSDPYKLYTGEDFTKVANAVAQGESFQGKYLVMMNDITLPDDWTGIGGLTEGATGTGTGKYILPFSGNLNGQNYQLTIPYGGKAPFTYVRKATVQNMNIYGEYINDYALVSNYVVDYGPDGDYWAGSDGGSYAAGCPDTINVINVNIVSGTVISGGGYLGGYASGANVCNFTDCTVYANVKIGWNAVTNKSSGQTNVGSFAGEVSGTFTNCVSYADVYGVDSVGGIAGAKGQSMGDYNFYNCAFLGTITATGKLVGGIAGQGYYSSSAPNTPIATIENCYVAATITGADMVGGIFGGEYGSVQAWNLGYIRNNHFYGTVTATDGVAGGIIGYMNSLDKYNVIENNYYLDSCGASAGIGRVNTANVDLSSGSFGRDDDPLGEDADKLAKAMSAEAFADGTVCDLLNSSDSSYMNWAQSAHYPVTTAANYLTSLTITVPDKTAYEYGEELDLTGLTITVTWGDGSTEELAIEDVTISGYYPDRAGLQTITVSYGAAKATFEVTVAPKAAEPENSEVTITLTVSQGSDFYITDQDQTMLNVELTVPYFDLDLYGLSEYYYTPDCYGETQIAGTQATADGVVTLMHALIYATEICQIGLDPEDAGQGLGDISGYINWSGKAGSSYMTLWNLGTNLNYYVNYTYPLAMDAWGATSDQIALSDGDVVTVHGITTSATGTSFTYFELDGDKAEGSVTEKHTSGLTLYTCVTDYETYKTSYEPLAGETVYYWNGEWTKLCDTDENGLVDTSALECGVYELKTNSRLDSETNLEYAPASFLLTVNACTDHDYESVVTVKPTCTEDGIVTYTCIWCGDSYTEEIKARGHCYKEWTVAPTCTEGGYTCHECINEGCDSYFEDDQTEALGHTYEDEQSTSCAVCGYTETVAMYRLYNPNSGEHFYTGNVEERDVLIELGWSYEGIAWYAPAHGGAPIYRLYNPNTGDHHYTGSQEEVDILVEAGWNYEGIAWHSPLTGISVYRLYNPYAVCGTHHYTTSDEERDILIAAGWQYEGISWYCVD